MKRRQFTLLPLAVAPVLLPGCGGGGGGASVADIGSGGTGLSGDPIGGVGSGGTGVMAFGVGVIEGFGSIVVNGTRYETDSARLDLADVSELKLGMTVRVAATVDPATGTAVATAVQSAADLRGPVLAVDPATGTFDVLIVRVTTDARTVFAGGLAGLADLRRGDSVQVHGLPQPDGRLRASRVERVAPTASVILTGLAGTVNTLLQALSQAGLPLDLAGNISIANLLARLQEGDAVRIRGEVAGTGVRASAVEPRYPVSASEGSVLSLAGVLQADPAGRLRIDGMPVDLSGAQVSGGPAAQAVAGAHVDVTGVLRAGVLVASRVRLRDDDDEEEDEDDEEDDAGNQGGPSGGSAAGGYSASGTIASVRGLGDFRIQGQAIDASGPGVQFVNGTAADVRAGRKAVVTGSRVEDDVLLAQRVEFLPGA